jgi:hypothetical protein
VGNRFFGWLMGALFFILLSPSLFAHHGSASFETSKDVTLKGTVTEWLWANPHCFLKVDVKDDTGAVKNWNLELGNPTDISARGYRRNLFKPGDTVTVVIQAVKNGSPVGRIRTVTLADGTVIGA